MNSKDSSLKGITETKFDPKQEAEWRLTVSISLQRIDMRHPSLTTHLVSVEEAILTEDQARGAANTFMQVMALVGVYPYLQQDEEELAKIFKDAIEKGLAQNRSLQ